MSWLLSYRRSGRSGSTDSITEMKPVPSGIDIEPAVTTVTAAKNTHVIVLIPVRWCGDSIDHPAVFPVLRRPVHTGLQTAPHP